MIDLLDALHYMFEEDLAPSSGEQQEAREHTRTKIYVDLYGKKSYRVSKKSPERLLTSLLKISLRQQQRRRTPSFVTTTTSHRPKSRQAPPSLSATSSTHHSAERG